MTKPPDTKRAATATNRPDPFVGVSNVDVAVLAISEWQQKPAGRRGRYTKGQIKRRRKFNRRRNAAIAEMAIRLDAVTMACHAAQGINQETNARLGKIRDEFSDHRDAANLFDRLVVRYSMLIGLLADAARSTVEDVRIQRELTYHAIFFTIRGVRCRLALLDEDRYRLTTRFGTKAASTIKLKDGIPDDLQAAGLVGTFRQLRKRPSSRRKGHPRRAPVGPGSYS